MDVLAMTVEIESRRTALDLYEKALLEAAAERHPVWCGSLEEWVQLVLQTRNDLDLQVEARFREGT